MPSEEELAAEIHGIYCRQYEKNNGKPYRTNGDYFLLDEPTKDYDRAFIRWHLERLHREVEKSESQCLALAAQVTKMREALDEAAQAIASAIYDEDGLDGGEGENLGCKIGKILNQPVSSYEALVGAWKKLQIAADRLKVTHHITGHNYLCDECSFRAALEVVRKAEEKINGIQYVGAGLGSATGNTSKSRLTRSDGKQ